MNVGAVSRGTRRSAPGGLQVQAAMAVGLGAGLMAATQMRLNGALGQRLGTAVLAALVCFASGLVALLIVVALRPATRRGLVRLARSDLPRWMYASGIGGALNVTTFTIAVPRIGVALYAMAAVSGQMVGGFAVDRLGVGPAGSRPPSLQRTAGALVALGAVVLSQLGKPTGQIEVGLIALAVAVNMLMALQIAVNGRQNKAAGDPIAATTVHFAGAALLVGAATAIVAGVGDLHVSAWPAQGWVYLGGVAGVFVIAMIAAAARTLDVLRMALLINGGQLAGGLIIDGLIPGGPGVSIWLGAGALLTLGAVWIAGRRPEMRPSRGYPADVRPSGGSRGPGATDPRVTVEARAATLLDTPADLRRS